MLALAGEDDIKISAANITEALIVANARDVGAEMDALIERIAPEVLPVTLASARRAADAYRHWGRGFHPASLNFGDCFAYEAAASHGGRLLFVGEDFTKTDLESVLGSARP